MLLVISPRSSTCGCKQFERHHHSIIFSLMGPVATELCQPCITVNLLLQQVQCIIKKNSTNKIDVLDSLAAFCRVSTRCRPVPFHYSALCGWRRRRVAGWQRWLSEQIIKL